MRAFFALVTSALLLASPALADAFTVRGVEVDETAGSAAQSRERAIAVGQQRAAQRLIERLTLPEDRVAIPPIDAGRAGRLVSGYQVEEEALAGARYIGRLTVAFDQGQVRDLLEEYNIPYVLSSARPAVVVPLYRQGEETLLWGSGNPWFDAWAVAGTMDELVPVLAPSGDLADLSVIDAPRALALDKPALQALAANYGAAHVLIGLAAAAPAGSAPAPAPGAAPSVAPGDAPATPAPADAGAPAPAAAAPASEPLMTARLVGIDFANGGQQTDYGVVGPAEPVELARAAAGLMQENWKRTMVVAEPFLTTAEVSVLFGSVDEWMALQGVIAGEPLVQRPQLDALTADGALMTIEHRGATTQLAMALREHGAELSETPNGLVIRSAVGAQTPSAPGALPPGAIPGAPAGSPGQTIQPGAAPGAVPAAVPAVVPGAAPAGQVMSPSGAILRPGGQSGQ